MMTWNDVQRKLRRGGQGLPRLLAVLACCGATAGSAVAQVTVVNMIPPALSDETHQDSEPNLAVSPTSPNLMAGSAFTSGSGFCASGLAPLFFSTNGGSNWAVNCTVPSDGMTGDITLRFGRGSTLYGGILARPGALLLRLLRTDNVILPVPLEVLAERASVDQPYVQAATVGGQDRVYVGDNDFGVTDGRTATLDQALDAATGPQPFGPPLRIEERTTVGQNGPPVRPAVHPDGTVYAVFYGWRSRQGSIFTSDVVVVRDDQGGAGASPYRDLLDSDGLAGRRVATNRGVPFENFSHPTFGQERLVASNLSIAVDPRNSDVVYVAWADRVASEVQTLHLRRSVDRGQTWSPDLRTVTNATNPALAVNDRGVVGFLFQQVSGSGSSQRWLTVLERSATGTFGDRNAATLATVPANEPSPQFLPYIGDYVHLTAVDGTLFGVFSANNTPNLAHFPQGVVYRRHASFATRELRTAGGRRVDASIDPFFFRAPTSFRLTAPGSVEAVPGGTATVQLSLLRDFGFTDAVDFDLLSAPPGVTGSFAPDPTTGTGSTLTLAIPASVPTGSYNVSVRASAGGVARTAVLTLALKSLVVTLSEPSVVLVAGEPARTVGVTLTRAAGFSEAVTLSLQLTPPSGDVSHQFIPASTTGTAATLRLHVGRFADSADHVATVSAAGATASGATQLGIEVFGTGLP